MNILVVDNEIVQIENIRIGLGERGYRVIQAQSGREALNLMEDGSLGIDLVITDYEMPEMNGIELLQNIRWKYGNLPVILMTAYEQKDIILEALRNRCNGYIDKPFTLDELLHVIDTVTFNGTLNINSVNPQKTEPYLPRVFV